MTPQELKNSILQRAIQGKLVEQRAEEGTAEELFARIQQEKQRLIAEKKMKKEKPLPEITEDEKPFEIPESWKWVRLKQVASVLYGYPFNSEKFNETNEGMPLIRIRDILSGVTKTFTTEVAPDNYLIYSGDMLVGMDGNFNVNFWTGSPAYLNQRVCKISAVSEYLVQEFLYYYLPTALSLVFKTVSFVTVKHLSDKHLTTMLVPLPPLAEQKRIVAKIKELLPYIDRYEQAWSKLEQFNSRFPENMKKSLLQYAIQGKLVVQRPEEGTAEELFAQIQQEKHRLIAEKKIKKEKPLPEITDDEKPFDIPESWKWVRFGMVIDMLSGYAFKSQDFKQEGNYRLLRGINLGVDTIRWNDTVYLNEISDKLGAYKLTIGDVLLGLDRPWISEGIRVAIFDDLQDTFLVQRVLRIREIGAVTNKYAALILRSALFMNAVAPQTTGISVPHISPTQVGNVAIPLPPLAEQKRIVEKLEQLLPLCERLK